VIGENRPGDGSQTPASAFHINTDDRALLSEVAAAQLAVELENTPRKYDELERARARPAVLFSTDRGQHSFVRKAV
jgi:hypothetical protein